MFGIDRFGPWGAMVATILIVVMSLLPARSAGAKRKLAISRAALGSAKAI